MVLIQETMEQFCSSRMMVGSSSTRQVCPVCPACSAEGARGDQCDACGATYEANELKHPVSKLNPEIPVEIRETDHLFFRLDLLQGDLENHAASRKSTWKPNVRAMTNWLNMGSPSGSHPGHRVGGQDTPRRREVWGEKRVYVWFDAVQGYLTCARIWSSA